MIKLSKKDFENILNISNHHFLDRVLFVNPFARAIKEWKEEKERTFEGSSEFYVSEVAENKSLMLDIRNYFIKNNNQDIAKIFEEKCISHYWNESIFVAYSRFIKEDIYYPTEPSKILKIIEEKKCTNSKTLWDLVSLSGYIKDDSESSKAFANIFNVKAKDRNLSLLDLEKIKRAWDKRFKNIKEENINPNALKVAKEVFDKIENSKKKNLYEFNTGEYIEVILDADLLSQDNKLSVPKNVESLNIFFNRFTKYVQNSKTPLEMLSITSVEFKSANQSKIRINFNDSKNKNTIQSVLKDLIDFSLVKDKTHLKGKNFIPDDPIKFFDAFLMNYALQEKISTKEEQKKNSFKL